MSHIETAVTKFFPPEFRNRIDTTIRFNKLGISEMHLIVDKEMVKMNDSTERNGVSVVLSVAARDWLATNGYDDKMGARPLLRLIQEKVKKPLSKLILYSDIATAGRVLVDVKNDVIVLEVTDDEVVTA